MRWYVILLAVFVAVLIACGSNGGDDDDEARIRETLQGFVQALNDSDFAAAYSYFSEGCKASQSFSEFTDGVESAEDFGLSKVEISNIRIIELADGRALIDAVVTVIDTGEEFSIAEDQQPGKLVKEDGQWRIVDCENEATEPASFAPPGSGVPGQSDRRYLALE